MSERGQGLPDFYGVLGVGFDASQDELRQAWREAVKRWHPDRNPGRDTHAEIAQVNEAWEVLGDPEKRAQYDTLYFMLRAAQANEERQRREADRLERERIEQARREERERRQREAEAAAKRAEEEARQRARREREARERQEREARERMERERKAAEERAWKHAEQERRAKEKREREWQKAEERQRKEDEKRRKRERVEQEREKWGGGNRVGRKGRGNAGVLMPFGVALVLVLGALATWFVIGATNDDEGGGSETVRIVAPTARPTATARPTETPRPAATRVPRVSSTPNPATVGITATPTQTPTARPTPSPLPTATRIPTPRLVPTATPDPDLARLDYIEPGSVHEYLLLTDRPSGEVIRRMIEDGAEFGYIDEIGFGSLGLAAGFGANADVLAALIDAGEEPSNSYLLLALLWSDDPTLGAVRVLIDAGVDVLYEDIDGLTAADIAQSRDEVPAAVAEYVAEATRDALGTVRVAATATVALPTPRVVPTATPRPTVTPVPTSSPSPTAAPLPTSTPSPSRTPTATPIVITFNEAATNALWSALSRRGYGTEPSASEVQYLIDLGADVTVVNSSGTTMFEYAVIRDYGVGIAELLSRGVATVTATNALWSALSRRGYGTEPSASEVQYLIDLGADVTVVNSSGTTMFEYAVIRDYGVGIAELLSRGVATVTATNALWSALSRRGYGTEPSSSEVQYLIDLGADVTVMNSSGTTMFEYAVIRDYGVDVARLLSRGVANVAATNALWSALSRRGYGTEPSSSEVQHLIDLGADVTVVNSSGTTMFEYAVIRDYGVDVARLLSRGVANVAATNALWYALSRRGYGTEPSSSEVQHLIDLGADVTVVNSSGTTMLEYAVGRGYSLNVIRLLEAGNAASIQTVPTPAVDASSTPAPFPQLSFRGSGTLYSRASEGLIGCPTRASEPAYLSSSATYGRVEFGFEMPASPGWSIGLLYHIGETDYDSATFVYGFREAGVSAGHWTRVDGENVDSIDQVPVTTGVFDTAPGALNDVAIRVDSDGTELELNGTVVLEVPIAELRPIVGPIQVCVGMLADETEDYLIDYIGLRAWTE